jgi:hypothetical protein
MTNKTVTSGVILDGHYLPPEDKDGKLWIARAPWSRQPQTTST